ncbi:TIGR01212 family radical SAM protein [Grimontia hollisae]|nr:TIGR01212 family radical SAM protein [Grimontia hollisae]AMG31052.1 TIGR01212 family radical SAM protein [Grimontia hollisae]MDF2184408.1 TIGR01212 family radical SAM protein [Grimontia hollisae]STO46808.1 coproporphyrinogen III oxidase [Grimontia hollisae]STQ76926.1 coproporphyrinogen III oxidase [Grimontia hollisae]
MELHQLVNTFGQDLQRRYGEKVHKLTLHGGFSCPNRDGTLGRGGCTFCNVSSFADESAQQLSVTSQLVQRASEVNRAKRYLAYFQAYTSTYAEVEKLRVMYEDALKHADIVGLCVGTRPDCVPDAVLELLAGYQQQGYEIWLELGLQTANDKTLQRINRGHDFACYDAITRKARALGLNVCTHLIVGLPGDTKADHITTIERVIETGTDGIKLHPLHIVEGSVMAKAWRAGRLDAMSLEAYVDSASEMIIRTPAEVVFHRVSANARKPTLLAPEWCENRWLAMTAIAKALNEKGPQGSLTERCFYFHQ